MQINYEFSTNNETKYFLKYRNRKIKYYKKY